MDERARKILDDAFATCERIDNKLKNMPERQPYDPYVPQERAPVERRTRGLDTTPEREQRLREEAQAESDAAFNAWFDQRFHQRLAEYMQSYSETVVNVTFKRLDAHKRALENEIKALRTEVATLKEVTKGHNVIELRHSDVA